MQCLYRMNLYVYLLHIYAYSRSTSWSCGTAVGVDIADAGYSVQQKSNNKTHHILLDR